MTGGRLPSGFDLAREMGAEEALAADITQGMLPQLLIALVKRAGGELRVPVAEIDDTGGYILSLRVDDFGRTFAFVVTKKQ